MNVLKLTAMASVVFLSGNSIAQVEDKSAKFNLDSLQEDGMILTIDSGFIPTSLESMVKLSDLVVKGRYGKLISHGPFYGYGSTKESTKEKYGITDESDLKFYSFPMSEYEIVVDEVLHGKLPKGPVIYRTYEDNPEDDRFVSKVPQRIFFLGLQPDNRTYGVLGAQWILENVEGRYYYLDFDENGNDQYVPLSFAQSNEVEAFEASLDVAVERVLTAEP